MRLFSKKEQLEIQRKWWQKRLDELLPELMKEQGIDFWLVACREYNEDPVFKSLMPPKAVSARRLSILMFSLQSSHVERVHTFSYDIEGFYKGISKNGEEPLDTALRYIQEKNPEKIALNISDHFAFGDGLSHGLYQQMQTLFPEGVKKKFCSAEKLCIRWLETRLDEEMEVYHRVNKLAHEIIAETFSPERVYPGITTSQDLEWYMLEKITSYGLPYWFPPDVYIHRKGETTNGVIQRGDILHCDMGLEYFGLQSDTQRLAYCLRDGEFKPPKGLQEAFKIGNRFQDIVASKFKVGKTGNQVFSEAMKEAKVEGIDAMLYTHPIGIHGHGAGPVIGLYDKQEEIPVRGDLAIHKNTCYALELNIKREIPEYDNIKEGIYLEQTVGFDGEKVIYFDDRQREFLLI